MKGYACYQVQPVRQGGIKRGMRQQPGLVLKHRVFAVLHKNASIPSLLRNHAANQPAAPAPGLMRQGALNSKAVSGPLFQCLSLPSLHLHSQFGSTAPVRPGLKHGRERQKVQQHQHIPKEIPWLHRCFAPHALFLTLPRLVISGQALAAKDLQQ